MIKIGDKVVGRPGRGSKNINKSVVYVVEDLYDGYDGSEFDYASVKTPGHDTYVYIRCLIKVG